MYMSPQCVIVTSLFDTLYNIRNTQYPVAHPFNSITIGITLCKCLMYLMLFSLLTVLQNAIDELRFGFWLHYSSLVLFEFMPHIFYRMKVRRFRWCSPPVDPVFRHPGCCIFGRMLCHHQPMTIRIKCID